MNRTNVTVHVDTADLTVAVHCELDNNRHAFRVEHGNADVTVYLTGTLDQLSAFAVAVADTCARHAIAEAERAAAGARS